MSKPKNKPLFIIECFILGFMLFVFVFPSYGSDRKPKEIYVVYDTSGSMLESNNVSSCPWYETGYALELLVAMMEQDDVVHVYYMDDDKWYREETYNYNSQDRLHNDLKKIAYTENTYVDGLFEAIQKLKANKNDSDKFLVILSDGDFNKRGEKSYTLDYKQEVEKEMENVDVEIIYLALSKETKELFNKPGMSDCKTKVFCAAEKELQTSENVKIFEMFTEMGNLIFDRKILDHEDSCGENKTREIKFNADLPMRRLIILCQSGSYQGEKIEEIKVRAKDTNEELTNTSGNKKISGIKVEELESEKEGWAHKKKNNGEMIYEGNFAGMYSIFTDSQGRSAKAGEYYFQVPVEANVDIFVEYETKYRILMRTQEEEWELLEKQSCLEGEYELEVQLIDTWENAPISDSAKIYDDLNINVFVEDQEEAESIPGSRKWKLRLSEGTAKVRVTSQLKGNIPAEEEQELTVNYRIKNPDISIAVPQKGFDVDKLGTIDQEKIYVTVTEDGKNISDHVEVSVEPYKETNTKYQYICEKERTRWMIEPQKMGYPIIGTDKLVVSVEAKNEQEEIWAKEVEVVYYATPKEFDFVVYNDEPKDIFGFYSKKITIVPMIDGEPVDLLNSGIDGEIEGELEGEAGNNMDMEPIGDQLITFQISFKNIFANLNLLFGGEIQGKVLISGMRYGQRIDGILPLKVEVNHVRWEIIIIFLIILYITILAAVKCGFKYNFPYRSLEIKFWRDFSGKPYEGRIQKIRTNIIRNMIHPLNSKIVIPLNDTGWKKVSELVIIQSAYRTLKIKNTAELMETGDVFVGRERLSPRMEFNLDKGIELNIQIDDPIRLLFRKKGKGE